MAQDVHIYAQLEKRLVTHGFEHGERLRAEVLRAEFGCSASAVREVLFRLSNVGLVDFQEQRGFRVPQHSKKLLNELTHLRVLLECEGSVLSIRQGGVAWEAQLSAAHHKLSHIERRIHTQGNPDGLIDIWFASEKEFHETLISACGSDILMQMHRQIYAQFRQQLMEVDQRFEFIPENINHHAGILEAALDGNEDLTQQRIHTHLARHRIAESVDV